MYADRQLATLASRKTLLQARITVRRIECVMAGAELLRPVAAFDRLWLHWKRLSPLVKLVGLPAAILTARKLSRSDDGTTSKGKLAAILGALPVMVEAWKGFREGVRAEATR